MKIEIEKVSNGWVIRYIADSFCEKNGIERTAIARNVPDCLAELSKIMEKA